jgi:hypothetical protein
MRVLSAAKTRMTSETSGKAIACATRFLPTYGQFFKSKETLLNSWTGQNCMGGERPPPTAATASDYRNGTLFSQPISVNSTFVLHGQCYDCGKRFTFLATGAHQGTGNRGVAGILRVL